MAKADTDQLKQVLGKISSSVDSLVKNVSELRKDSFNRQNQTFQKIKVIEEKIKQSKDSSDKFNDAIKKISTKFDVDTKELEKKLASLIKEVNNKDVIESSNVKRVIENIQKKYNDRDSDIFKLISKLSEKGNNEEQLRSISKQIEKAYSKDAVGVMDKLMEQTTHLVTKIDSGASEETLKELVQYTQNIETTIQLMETGLENKFDKRFNEKAEDILEQIREFITAILSKKIGPGQSLISQLNDDVEENIDVEIKDITNKTIKSISELNDNVVKIKKEFLRLENVVDAKVDSVQKNMFEYKNVISEQITQVGNSLTMILDNNKETVQKEKKGNALETKKIISSIGESLTKGKENIINQFKEIFGKLSKSTFQILKAVKGNSDANEFLKEANEKNHKATEAVNNIMPNVLDIDDNIVAYEKKQAKKEEQRRQIEAARAKGMHNRIKNKTGMLSKISSGNKTAKKEDPNWLVSLLAKLGFALVIGKYLWKNRKVLWGYVEKAWSKTIWPGIKKIFGEIDWWGMVKEAWALSVSIGGLIEDGLIKMGNVAANWWDKTAWPALKDTILKMMNKDFWVGPDGLFTNIMTKDFWVGPDGFFTKIFSKDFLVSMSGIFTKIFSKDFWVGQDGIFTKIFSKDFWVGPDGLFTKIFSKKFWSDMFSEANNIGKGLLGGILLFFGAKAIVGKIGSAMMGSVGKKVLQAPFNLLGFTVKKLATKIFFPIGKLLLFGPFKLLGWGVKKVATFAGKIAKPVLDIISSSVRSLVNGVRSLGNSILSKMGNTSETIASKSSGFFSGAMDFVKSSGSKVLGKIKSVGGGIARVAKSVGSKVGEYGKAGYNIVKKGASMIGGAALRQAEKLLPKGFSMAMKKGASGFGKKLFSFLPKVTKMMGTKGKVLTLLANLVINGTVGAMTGDNDFGSKRGIVKVAIPTLLGSITGLAGGAAGATLGAIFPPLVPATAILGNIGGDLLGSWIGNMIAPSIADSLGYTETNPGKLSEDEVSPMPNIIEEGTKLPQVNKEVKQNNSSGNIIRTPLDISQNIPKIIPSTKKVEEKIIVSKNTNKDTNEIDEILKAVENKIEQSAIDSTQVGMQATMSLAGSLGSANNAIATKLEEIREMLDTMSIDPRMKPGVSGVYV